MTTQSDVLERADGPGAPRFGMRPGRALHLLWLVLAWTLVALFFLAGALLLTVRYVAMPRVDELRPRIEQIASRAIRVSRTRLRKRRSALARRCVASPVAAASST